MPYIAFDTETFPIVQHGKATRNSTPRFVCLTWYDGDTAQITKDRADALEHFRSWLNDPNTTIIAHNTSYDILVMLRLAREEGYNLWPDVFDAYADGRIRDTRVREILIDIANGGRDRRGYRLDRLERKYLSRDRSDQKKGDDVWRLRYNELAPWPVDTWPDDAVDYALKDAIGAYEIFQHQTEEAGYDAFDSPIVEGDQVVNGHLQTCSDLVFGLTSSWGLHTDPIKAEELDDHYGQVVKNLESDLKDRGLMRECGTKDKRAIQEVVLRGWEAIGQDPVLTSKGPEKIEEAQGEGEAAEREALISAVSTSKKDALRPLQKAGFNDPAFQKLTEYNQAVKFRSTYLEPVADAYPYAVCPGYNVLVDSGRSSSWGPNIQNIPARGDGAEIRKCFVPRPGNAFVQCDYSSMELRTLAQACLNLGLDSEMAKALNQGRDLHLDFACRMNGWDYDTAADRLEAGNKEVKHERQVAKIANFGYPGGLGASTFVEYAANFGTEIAPEQSQRLRDEWLKSWPEMETYFAYINAQERWDGKVKIQQHGPHGSVGGWRTRLCDSYTSACNTLFQGLAADAIKLAMWNVARACYVDQDSPLYRFKIVAMIHDELILEGPEERAEEAAPELSRLMCEAGAMFCPDVPIEAEPEIMDRWRKD